jgi:hypothetical protein
MRGDKKGRCGHSYLESTRAYLKAPQKLEATIIKECVFQHPKAPESAQNSKILIQKHF